MVLRIVLAGIGLALACGGAYAAAKPRPAASLLVINARPVAATELTISAEDKTVTLPKPLAPKARTTLKLPKLQGCTVAVSAIFADESVAEFAEFDICKEKSVRFTD